MGGQGGVGGGSREQRNLKSETWKLVLEQKNQNEIGLNRFCTTLENRACSEGVGTDFEGVGTARFYTRKPKPETLNRALGNRDIWKSTSQPCCSARPRWIIFHVL